MWMEEPGAPPYGRAGGSWPKAGVKMTLLLVMAGMAKVNMAFLLGPGSGAPFGLGLVDGHIPGVRMALLLWGRLSYHTV